MTKVIRWLHSALFRQLVIACIGFVGWTTEAHPQYVFDDEFSGNALDTSAWAVMNRPGDSSNSELQYYLPTNVVVTGGNLAITSRADISQAGYSYTSGMIQWKSFNFTYGTIEVRARLAGSWPAIWMLGYNCQASNILSADNVAPCNWPQPGSNEIDIAEIKNQDFTHVWQNLFNGSSSLVCSRPPVTDVSQNFHVYTLIWAANSLTWQIDGVTTCTTQTNVPTTPLFLLINVAMGGNGGAIGALPQTTVVDYVRVTPAGASPLPAPTNLRIVQ